MQEKQTAQDLFRVILVPDLKAFSRFINEANNSIIVILIMGNSINVQIVVTIVTDHNDFAFKNKETLSDRAN